MTAKVIKTESEYEAALAEIRALIDLDPDPGTPEGDRLELLALLVQDYESKKYRIEPPDPIEAIEFRMEQQDLSPRDLVPYLGSRSKVSEVLSAKRPLTLSMIRALHAGLGIPAGVLLREGVGSRYEVADIEWERFPLKEMMARGWISGDMPESRDQAEALLQPFFASLNSSVVPAALYRRTRHVRSARLMDDYALAAWTARVVMRATECRAAGEYKPGSVDLHFMQQVARLSVSDTGPLLACEFLRDNSIGVVVERQLLHTYLDGATVMVELERPVIGLTLRYDRIDSFWFTLMHELAHLALYLGGDTACFYDDLDVESQDDLREREADQLAREALIPEEEWKRSPASRLRSPEAAEHLAKRLGIHPAIVAGRMRHEFRAYRLLNGLVGHGEVRKHFAEVDWS